MCESKYTPEEILLILIAFYNCQSVFDPEVSPGEELCFETTISDWQSICDLVAPKPLAKYYYDLFDLTTSVDELEQILSNEKNNLSVFCEYIAENAIKETISPARIMGQHCLTASIFKTLITGLKSKGVDTGNIKPSSLFVPLFHKHGATLLEEVNRLAPGALSDFERRDNRFTKVGGAIIAFSILSIIVFSAAWHFQWAWLFPLVAGIVLFYIGDRIGPAREVIGGYATMRDLILGMQAEMTDTTKIR